MSSEEVGIVIHYHSLPLYLSPLYESVIKTERGLETRPLYPFRLTLYESTQSRDAPPMRMFFMSNDAVVGVNPGPPPPMREFLDAE